MASLYPRHRPVETPETESVEVEIADEAAASVFDCLASETCREILNHLCQNPASASDLADVIDTSPQNVHYHLDKLVQAELIEQVGEWYSSRGIEMPVYAPTKESITLSFEDTE